MLSKKSKYGLKAVLALAEESGRGPVLISELADRQRLPRKFLEAILLELKRHGILQSKKGKGGGYFLRHDPSQDYARTGDSRPGGAAGADPLRQPDGLHEVRGVLDEETCGIRLAMKEVRDATAQILDNTTLQA